MVWSPAAACSLVVACVAFAGAIAPASAATPAADCRGADAHPNRTSLKAQRTAITCLMNAERKHRGVASLSRSRRLARSAGSHSREMIRYSYFDHERPGGPSFAERIRRCRYASGATRVNVSENLAWGIGPESTPRAMVEDWMASPEHAHNILDSKFHNLGVGVARGVPDPSFRPSDQSLPDAMVATVDFGARR